MKIYILILNFLLIFNIITNVNAINPISNNNEVLFSNDLDPLVDIAITIDIIKIRSLDNIDLITKPDFYLIIFVNREKFTSPIWNNTDNLKNCWNLTKNVPDENRLVNISIQLFDKNNHNDKHCDIGRKSGKNNYGLDANVIYDIGTGLWYGSDHIGDKSGYGRLNGCDDGSVYMDENDCEIWFNIYQNDYDNDGLPYWVESNIYNTDTSINNVNMDNDLDNIPIYWEHKWGYNPFIWNDHQNIDTDLDSINNYEEYLMSEFGSDPFRKDIFLEMDFMDYEDIDDNEIYPTEIREIIEVPFHRRNIIFHLITEELDGGEIIPFDKQINQSELLDIYNEYFLHNDEYNWKRGIFHYGIIANYSRPNGYAFSGDVPPYWGYIPGTNGFILSSQLMKRIDSQILKKSSYIYASLIMHEMGHNFGIRWGNPLGCDSQLSKYPWQIGYWIYRNYKSLMNYRYTYTFLDYSDGSHGKRDHDDWEKIDFTYFENPNKKF